MYLCITFKYLICLNICIIQLNNKTKNFISVYKFKNCLHYTQQLKCGFRRGYFVLIKKKIYEIYVLFIYLQEISNINSIFVTYKIIKKLYVYKRE